MAAQTSPKKGVLRKGAKAAADPHRLRRVAEYDSECPMCGDLIHHGDPIVLDDDELWVHDPECL